jgi:hypothetical protein
MLKTVEEIGDAIIALSPDALEEFHSRYEAFDAKRWDEEFEHDINAGRLEEFGDAALAEHRAGKPDPCES